MIQPFAPAVDTGSAVRRGGVARDFAALLGTVLLLGCGRSDQPNQSMPRLKAETRNIADGAKPPAVAPPPSVPVPSSSAPGGATSTIPASMFGKFAPELAECGRFYGPVTISADRIDFGWGRVEVRSVMRTGSMFRIAGDLDQEGQAEPKTERVIYTLSKPARGASVLFGIGGDVKAYQPCPTADATATVPTAGEAGG